jgi:long-chain fatty acid transport protein
MNPLFPAIIKNHYTAGLGYALSPASSVDFSLAYAPEVSVTNDNMGVTTKHSQTNWQLMFSQRF